MFKEIRPYNDSEVPAALSRVTADPHFGSIVQYLFPGAEIAQCRHELLQIKTVKEFQEKIMLRSIVSIVEQTSDGLTHSGLELLNSDQRYLFVSNHRDILLDAALLQILLNQHHHETSEITFGSNLMQGQLPIDIGKLNKMFRIDRSGSRINFYKKLLEVSQYMRHTILDKQQSIWIAQRNGRTKNGHDKTEIALLKMLASSSDRPFAENLSELNITPLAISYEYEPCDFLKTQELYISRRQQYVKQAGEDLRSILHGITQQKGRIHLTITPTITYNELQQCATEDKNARFSLMAQLIDRRIYDSYKLWPTNFIAHDLLCQETTYADRYTAEERDKFVCYMNEGLDKLEGDREELREIFLGIYANSINNLNNK